MTVRNPLLAALCLAGILLSLRVSPLQAQSAPTALLAAPADSGALATGPVVAAREAYQAAWTQRQSGDAASAMAVLDPAMTEVDRVLQSSPDASVRRELLEIMTRREHGSLGCQDHRPHALVRRGVRDRRRERSDHGP